MSNYHFNLAKRGYTFAQIIRIAARLAAISGHSRLAWINRHGRAHIIADYGHDETGAIIGNRPPHNCIDWNRGGLCELTRL